MEHKKVREGEMWPENDEKQITFMIHKLQEKIRCFDTNIIVMMSDFVTGRKESNKKIIHPLDTHAVRMNRKKRMMMGLMQLFFGPLDVFRSPLRQSSLSSPHPPPALLTKHDKFHSRPSISASTLSSLLLSISSSLHSCFFLLFQSHQIAMIIPVEEKKRRRRRKGHHLFLPSPAWAAEEKEMKKSSRIRIDLSDSRFNNFRGSQSSHKNVKVSDDVFSLRTYCFLFPPLFAISSFHSFFDHDHHHRDPFILPHHLATIRI